jgi:deoxycytidine triphosphate deaminase
MGILTKKEIIERLLKNELLINPRKNRDNEFDVEAASYDLAAGIAVVKHDGVKVFSKRAKKFNFVTGKVIQDTVTLNPGQMMFVITQEEIIMPDDLCGTVYSRNSLAQKGVLALNAGHVDPGYQGPITIKLINLRNTKFTLCLGEPIFTIVFTKLECKIKDLKGQTITQDETLKRVLLATDLSLDNALYDLALLNNFIKKGEFGKEYFKWVKTSIWGMLTTLFTLLGAFVALSKIYELSGFKEWFNHLFK